MMSFGPRSSDTAKKVDDRCVVAIHLSIETKARAPIFLVPLRLASRAEVLHESHVSLVRRDEL